MSLVRGKNFSELFDEAARVALNYDPDSNQKEETNEEGCEIF